MDGMGTPGEGLGRCSHALIRGVPESLASGEGAAAGLPALDLAKAQREHGVLGGKLRQRLGLQLVELPPEESLPLGPLLGDTAVIQGDTALITRPWSPARRPEVSTWARVRIRGKKDLDIPGFGEEWVIVPLRTQGCCGVGRGLSGLHCVSRARTRSPRHKHEN